MAMTAHDEIAREWLDDARITDEDFGKRDHLDHATLCALTGIGHALLAIHEELSALRRLAERSDQRGTATPTILAAEPQHDHEVPLFMTGALLSVAPQGDHVLLRTR
jgi:hypothetical protein